MDSIPDKNRSCLILPYLLQELAYFCDELFLPIFDLTTGAITLKVNYQRSQSPASITIKLFSDSQANNVVN